MKSFSSLNYSNPNAAYGDLAGSLLGGEGSGGGGGKDQVNIETGKLIGERGEPFELITSVSILESDVFALNMADSVKLSPDYLIRAASTSACVGLGAEIPNPEYFCRLLRLCRKAKGQKQSAKSKARNLVAHTRTLTLSLSLWERVMQTLKCEII
jgi:hypothetical protein